MRVSLQATPTIWSSSHFMIFSSRSIRKLVSPQWNLKKKSGRKKVKSENQTKKNFQCRTKFRNSGSENDQFSAFNIALCDVQRGNSYRMWSFCQKTPSCMIEWLFAKVDMGTTDDQFLLFLDYFNDSLWVLYDRIMESSKVCKSSPVKRFYQTLCMLLWENLFKLESNWRVRILHPKGVFWVLKWIMCIVRRGNRKKNGSLLLRMRVMK